MSEGMKKNIQAAIAATNDQNMRSLLLLLLGVLEEIGDKLDALVADGKHHDDHDYLKAVRNFDSTRKAIDQWAIRKMQEEKEEADQAKSIKQQFLEAVVNQAGSIIVVAIATAVGIMSYLK